MPRVNTWPSAGYHHGGIVGNEAADTAAKDAILSMPQVDTNNIMCLSRK